MAVASYSVEYQHGINKEKNMTMSAFLCMRVPQRQRHFTE